MTSLSLVVCTYERPKAVKKLLSAVEGQSRHPDEVLVIDGSRTDATRRLLAVHPMPVDYVQVSDQDRGLTCQRNLGVSISKGDIVAFLDDDTLPEPDYFQELIQCFESHPDAIGVGGYLHEIEWTRGEDDKAKRSYRSGEWSRPEGLRWLLRRWVGLAPEHEAGHMPPSGHGRPASFIPPDGRDHRVEFLMGGASAWKREVFARCEFDKRFEGYGLYEDLDFCIRAGRYGQLFVATRAGIQHHHEPSGRPQAFSYGRMVVQNGWMVWRERWPSPPTKERFRWWATTCLLALSRLLDLRAPLLSGPADAAGRFIGALELLIRGAPDRGDER